MFVLSPLLLAASLLLSHVEGAYVGCLSSAPSFASSKTGITSQAACITACGTTFPYSFWKQSTLSCRCSTGSGSGRDVVTSAQADCTTNFQSNYLGTTFHDPVCASTVTFDPRDAANTQSQVTYPNECFTKCKSFRYAFMKPVNTAFSNSYYCTCANYEATTAAATTCGQTYYAYAHTAGEAASGLARRAATEAKIEKQRILDQNPFCPIGYDACYISESADDGYECLRSQYELESCGGCRFGHFGVDRSVNQTVGVDCTALPGVISSAVTCDEGDCVASRCRRGYTLRGGVCV